MMFIVTTNGSNSLHRPFATRRTCAASPKFAPAQLRSFSNTRKRNISPLAQSTALISLRKVKMSLDSDTEKQLLKLSQSLLDAIDRQNWAEYTLLVDPSLSSFEPEGRGHLIEGLTFHQFYFNADMGSGHKQSTISLPKVRLMGDVALVTYVRLVQMMDGNTMKPVGGTGVTEETRVWKKVEGEWRNIHFHRSKPGE